MPQAKRSKAKPVKTQPPERSSGVEQQGDPPATPTGFIDRIKERVERGPSSTSRLAGIPGEGLPGSSPDGGSIPDLYTFAGFLWPDNVTQPGGDTDAWRLLFLDVRLSNWLLVEKAGIWFQDKVKDENVPGDERDVLWVIPDTGVGIGRGSPSREATFLVGDFTRAADFRSSPAGGTLAAATGVFCEAESVGCCRPSSRR